MNTTSYYRPMVLAPSADESYFDISVQAFCDLYAIEIIQYYLDGRIKARTARGTYLDLRTLYDYRRNIRLPDTQVWIQNIKNL